jgi:AcrR family transcriptional regulator
MAQKDGTELEGKRGPAAVVEKPPRGRPRGFDRDAALESAMRLFWSHGFLGTSNSDLCKAMGINSPSLYAAFGSKESLYVEAVGRYTELARASIWHHLSDAATAREGMQNALLAAAEAMPANKLLPSGCMITLATVGDECPTAVSEAVKGYRRAGLDLIRQCIKRGVAAGELPQSTDVAALSRFFSGVVQGMAIQARDGATKADLRPVAKVAMATWQTT